MLKVLVSGCLAGRPIRFNETSVPVCSPIWEKWAAEGRLVHFCPELAVGFPVPRPAAEIVGGTAAGVLDGAAHVREVDGRDVTDLFRLAARRALHRAVEANVALAVLVDGSPTCGSSTVYDGSFAGRTVPGRGVAAEELQRHGIPVFHEGQLEQAASLLEELERNDLVAPDLPLAERLPRP
ncbi:DUF523 domain-containing protein [Micromonospora sp. NPDC052213]|uniref:DUF523 domain-containing protein n=1 Tax=Micromonospora sp. NPDC052213 TaxID=3155812 RepID=UPI00342027AB